LFLKYVLANLVAYSPECQGLAEIRLASDERLSLLDDRVYPIK